MYTILINQHGSINYDNRQITTPCMIKDINLDLIEAELRKQGLDDYEVLLDTHKIKTVKGNFAFGYNVDPKDSRDYDVKDILTAKQYTSSKNSGLPKRINLCNGMSPVRNQGNLGACVGFAVTAMKEWQERHEYIDEVQSGSDYRRESEYYNLSEQWAYYKAKEIDPWPNSEGTGIRYALKQAQKYGIPPEKAWPYNDSKKGKPKIWSKMISKWAKGGNYYKVKFEDLERTLYEVGPVVIGIPCFKEIFNVGNDGIVPYPSNPSMIYGYHAVCVCGYDRPKGFYKFRNSWGGNWGRHGYGFIPYRYLKDFMVSAWVMEDIDVGRNLLRED